MKPDFDFPRRAKLRELLQSDNNYKLQSVSLCHQKDSEALYGIRLNYNCGHSSELIRTSHNKDSVPI